MRRVVALGLGVALAAACAVADRPAEACGGCFHPVAPRQVTVVTGHRMAFSISPQQTVLWDQIKYSGEPQDFAWVLPVRPGAQVQVSHDELFEALDALTDPVITGPTPNCSNNSSPSFGCGGSSANGLASFSPGASGGGDTVQVLSQGVVGPYEQVTLLAERVMQGGGGRTWLTEFSALTSLYGSPSSVTSAGNYSCGSPGTGGAASSFGNPTLPSLYYGQCLCETAPTCADGSEAGEAEADAGDAGGLTGPAPTCTPCAAFDDLQVATVGLDPESTWVTRMRAILPATALATDLAIEAATPQSAVSSQYTASVYDDPTYDPCTASNAAGGAGGNGGGGCSAVDTSPMLSGRELAAGSLVMLWAAGLRRRWQRRQRPG